VDFVSFLEILSITIGAISVVIGITAIVMAINSEKRSKDYFDKIIKIEQSIHTKLQDVDKEILDVIDNDIK